MESLPDNLLFDEIISNLDLSDIYSYCQVNQQMFQQCRRSSFWTRLGTNRHPDISKLLPISQGRVYQTLGHLIWEMNEYLKENNVIHLEVGNVNLLNQPAYLVSILGQDNTTMSSKIAITIYHLTSDTYLIQARTEDPFLNSAGGDYVLSPHELEEYLLALNIVSDEIGIYANSPILNSLLRRLHQQVHTQP